MDLSEIIINDSEFSCLMTVKEAIALISMFLAFLLTLCTFTRKRWYWNKKVKITPKIEATIISIIIMAAIKEMNMFELVNKVVEP